MESVLASGYRCSQKCESCPPCPVTSLLILFIIHILELGHASGHAVVSRGGFNLHWLASLSGLWILVRSSACCSCMNVLGLQSGLKRVHALWDKEKCSREPGWIPFCGPPPPGMASRLLVVTAAMSPSVSQLHSLMACLGRLRNSISGVPFL